MNHYYTHYQDDQFNHANTSEWKAYGLKSFKNLLYYLGYPTDDPMDFLTPYFTYHEYEAGTVIQEQGALADQLFFIIKGSLKIGAVQQGQQQIFSLVNDGNLATAFFDFFAGTPSTNLIETCSHTRLLVISKQAYDEATGKMVPAGIEAVLNNLNQHVMKHIMWFQGNLYHPSMERVEGLYKRYPDIFSHFSDTDIAIYLGMARETFCRMKKEVFRAGQAISRV